MRSSVIPVRWIISTLGIYASALLFAQRASLSVSIVAMTTVQQSATRTTIRETTSQDCIERPSNLSSMYSSRQDEEPEFVWNETLQGVILGSQFYLYIIVPTFAGRITDVFGGKWLAFVGAIGPCILSVITPVAVRAGGAGVLIAIRTLMGGFQGCIYPAMFSLYIKWFPVQERASANAGLSFGSGFGSAVMYIVAGWLCQTEMGWPLVFYVCTALYIPWMVLWVYYCSNEPENNPRVSEEELLYIQTHNPKNVAKKKHKTKWLAIFISIPVLCSAITKLCAGFGFNLFTTKMPSYLSTIFGVDIFKNGAVNAAATLAQAVCSLLSGPLSNWIIKRYQIRSLLVRKVFQSVALLGPAVCLFTIPLWGCNAPGVMVMLITAMLLYGCYTGGEWTIISEFAPNSAGAVFGYASILAYVSGVVVPYLVGVLLDSDSAAHRERWNMIFLITAGVYVFGAVTFVVFGTDKQQKWDKVEEDDGDEVKEGDDNKEDNSVEIKVKS